MASESPSKRQKQEGRVIDSRPYTWPFDRDLRPENTVCACVCACACACVCVCVSVCVRARDPGRDWLAAVGLSRD